MNSRYVHRTGIAVAVVAALTGLTACGGADTGKSKADGTRERQSEDGTGAGNSSGGNAASAMTAALHSADRSTGAAESSTVEATMEVGDAMGMRTSGEIAWSDGVTGSMTMQYTKGLLAQKMRQQGVEDIEVRYLPDAYYTKTSDEVAAQSGGKHWIRYAYEDVQKDAGPAGAFVNDQLQNATPNQSVKLLLASGDVRELGTETVRGKKATHYRGTLKVSELAEATSGLDRKQLEGLEKQLDAAGITTETIDIWIDDQDLMVKKTEQGDTAQGRMVSTAFYSDYGTEVTAKAPPAADTIDFEDLMKSAH